MEKRIMSKKLEIIKQIKEAHNLPNDKILDLVARNGGSLSDSTLRRILAENSEEQSFQYSSIADLYNALTLEFGEDFKDNDPTTLKALLSERNRWIDRLAEEIESIKEEHKAREALYAQRKDTYERTITILQERIDKQDALIEQLLTAHLERS